MSNLKPDGEWDGVKYIEVPELEGDHCNGCIFEGKAGQHEEGTCVYGTNSKCQKGEDRDIAMPIFIEATVEARDKHAILVAKKRLGLSYDG